MHELYQAYLFLKLSHRRCQIIPTFVLYAEIYRILLDYITAVSSDHETGCSRALEIKSADYRC